MTKTIFHSSSSVSALAKIIMIFQFSLMVKRSYSFTASLSLGLKHPYVTTFGKNDAIYQCNRLFNRMPSRSTLSSTIVKSTTNKENTTFERPKRFVPFPFDVSKSFQSLHSTRQHDGSMDYFLYVGMN